MSEFLPPFSTAFVAASFVLAVTPGPGVFYIVTQSLVQGRRSGLASVAGVAFGNLANAIGASVGLAALFAVSSLAFTIVKYAGALYLIYLGIRVLRAPGAKNAARPEAAPLRCLFGDGFAVALLNPKTTLFFAAFLPQFMAADTAPMLQGVTLGALFAGVTAVTDTVYALAAGSIVPLLARAQGFRTLGRYLSASAFIGLGVFTALAGVRNTN